MKKPFLLLLLITSFFSAYSQKPDAVIDVLHYTFNVSLNDTTDIIEGHALVSFKVLKPTKSILLNLVSISENKKGMVVLSVLDGQPISYQHNNDILKISFNNTLEVGTEKEIEIFYKGVPKEGLLIGPNKFRRRSFFADHWPDRARNWLPCVDHLADKAMVDFVVTAPDHYQVIANGIQVEESTVGNHLKLTHYKETVPLPTKVMVIGVADFAVQLAGMVDCIPVQSWIYPEDRVNGFEDYSDAVKILPFYINNIGPYGYKKLANVQSKTTYGGLENASAIFYYENSITGTHASEGLMAHEIAHQWFGNMATEKEWAHVWLSEGFATYMTNLYMESQYGRDTLVAMLKKQREETISFSKKNQRPIVDSSTTNLMQLLNANSYQKGGWILHMLRVQLGDSTFWKGIRTYYARFAGKNATTEDLQKAFEDVSGKPLGYYFKQWLYTPGQPKLDISWTYDTEKKIATYTILQKQETSFIFPLELQIVGGSEDGIITKSIQIKDKETKFNLPMSEAPVKIVVDPNVKLLFEKA